MRKILALALVMVMVIASMITVSAGEVVDIEDRVKYGVHIDSFMEVYENLEAGIYKVEMKAGYEDKVGSVRNIKNGEIVDAVIGEGYIELVGNESIVTENTTLTKIAEIESNIKTTLENGTYIVGKELEVGSYSVETLNDLDGMITVYNHLRLDATNKIGEVKILRAGEVMEFEVTEEHYAIYLQDLRITKVK